jgi:hypothetical protein
MIGTETTDRPRRHRRLLSALLLAAALLTALFATSARAANLGIVGSLEFPNPGFSQTAPPGSLASPQGIAINPTGAGGVSPGSIYVPDGGGSWRIDQFDPSGVFIRAFGFDVVASGEDNSDVDGQVAIAVKATGGTFALSYNERATASLPYDVPASGGIGASASLENAINSLSSLVAFGETATVTGGPGDPTGSNPYLISFHGNDVQQAVRLASSALTPPFPSSSITTPSTEEGAGGAPEVCNANPPSDDVCKSGVDFTTDGRGGMIGSGRIAISPTTGDVYDANEARGRIEEFSPTGEFLRNFGLGVVASGPDKVTPTSSVQTLTVSATSGEFDLEFGGQQTPGLPAGATPAEIQAALQALPAIGSGNLTVSETGPGIYRLTFSGALADNPEPTIAAASDPGEPLTGGDAFVAETTAGATGSGVCTAADVCQAGEPTGAAGAIDGPTDIAVAPSGAPNAGNVLVADFPDSRVDEFTPTGAFIRAFGYDVVAAGPDNTGTGFEECVAARGDACQAGTAGSGIGQFGTDNHNGLGLSAVVEDSTGAIYTLDTADFRIQKFSPKSGSPALSPAVFGSLGAPNGTSESNLPGEIAIGAGDRVLVLKSFPAGATSSCPGGAGASRAESRLQEFSPSGALLETGLACNGVIDPVRGNGSNNATRPVGLAETPAGEIYVAVDRVHENSSPPQPLYILGPDGGPPSLAIESVTPHVTGATISAIANPNGPGDAHPNPPQTSYRLEYRLSGESAWKPFAGERSIGSGTADIPLTVNLGSLEGARTYEVRMVATKQFGEGAVTTPIQTFTTQPAPPAIESFSSANVTATSADLRARINPHGTPTRYRFEYGSTDEYGATVPTPEGEIETELFAGHLVEVHLPQLAEGLTYHFRVIATSTAGEVSSEDQTFEFAPPDCPNSAVRQQTQTNYLPDCRAYELVSPEDANATLLFSGGPNSGLATNPPRFAYTGAFGSLSGAEPMDNGGDLYVATRTDSGWVSRYVGLPGSQASCLGGPPTEPTVQAFTSFGPARLTNPYLTDPSMDEFMAWPAGAAGNCTFGRGLAKDSTWSLVPTSLSPYTWNAEGVQTDHLPTDLAALPGAAESLRCSYTSEGDEFPDCTGDATASGDLSHFVFSSNQLEFTGQSFASSLGAAYDNDVSSGAISLISLDADGHPLQPQPTYTPLSQGIGAEGQFLRGQFIRFPAVSTDGSHILMSTATRDTQVCSGTTNPPCARFTDTPVGLYMRVGDAVTYEIAAGQPVTYVGMTPDGRHVYFTTERRLLPEDNDTSTDLYMWSQAGEEAGHPLTLISQANGSESPGEAGDTDECSTTWTQRCGVVTYSSWGWAQLPAGEGGNATSDTPIATSNGDIYFYSPELLAGPDHGVEGQQNLFDYREGSLRFIASFPPGTYCHHYGHEEGEAACTDGPIARLEVSPDDSHMAFLTADRMTSYDNAGHLEMYSYNPADAALVCDSCNPDGQPATADVEASQDGLFMTDDGRTFFSTTESLVPRDTDAAQDIYEFVEGRPQLITPGTGTAHGQAVESHNTIVSLFEHAGLSGVSANGTDVYFSTWDPLVSQDHNGNFLKFYDARTDGGFALPTPEPPCSAAEECHAPASSAPSPFVQGTVAGLTGGNATPAISVKHKKHKKAKRRKKATAARRHKRSGHNRGGNQ